MKTRWMWIVFLPLLAGMVAGMVAGAARAAWADLRKDLREFPDAVVDAYGDVIHDELPKQLKEAARRTAQHPWSGSGSILARMDEQIQSTNTRLREAFEKLAAVSGHSEQVMAAHDAIAGCAGIAMERLHELEKRMDSLTVGTGVSEAFEKPVSGHSEQVMAAHDAGIAMERLQDSLTVGTGVSEAFEKLAAVSGRVKNALTKKTQ